MASIYRDASQREQARIYAMETLADYAADVPDRLFALLAEAEQFQFSVIYSKLELHRDRAIELGAFELAKRPADHADEVETERLAKRSANVAVALLRLGVDDKVWPLLGHSSDPRARSHLIHAMGPLGCDPRVVVDRLENESNVAIRAALILALGEFSPEQFPAAERVLLIVRLLDLYEFDGDAGVHGAAEWLLRQWGAGAQVDALSTALHNRHDREATESRRWYMNAQGQTMVIFHSDEFLMGSPASETGRGADEPQFIRRLPHRFAMATQEVTHGQFTALQATQTLPRVIGIGTYIKSDDSPQMAMSWYEAAAYCNWLSENEGISPDHWCYEPNAQGEYAAGMKVKIQGTDLRGYRLPSEAEWEYACRAGTVTSRYSGSSESLMEKYAWYFQNSRNRTWPVASLKPNDSGMFDMLGNVAEWCHDAYGTYFGSALAPVIDTFYLPPVADDTMRVHRGGGFLNNAEQVRAAYRGQNTPSSRSLHLGFRVARTYP